MVLDMKWLRKLSVAKKLAIIISLLFIVLLLGFANFWLSMKIMSGIRAYVGGEGLWSKSQKEAVSNLVKYSTTFEEDDYQRYQAFLQIPLGDKQARLELQKSQPNLQIAAEGFVLGGNNSVDVPELIFLFRWFKEVSYMKIAIEDWTQGDAHIEELMQIGEKIHSLVVTTRELENPVNEEERLTELSALVMETYDKDRELTILENHFSATLSEGSRWIRDVLTLITVVLGFTVGGVIFFIAAYIAYTIVEVDKKKNEFISLVSHQLKTPLTSIGWYAELLLQDGTRSKEKQRQYLEEISVTNKRVTDLVNRLLSVSRIEMGTFVTNPVASSVVSLVDEVISSFGIQQSKRGITLIKEYQSDLPKLSVDPQIIRIVVTNLLSNAIKYSYDNGKIVVSLYKKNHYICIKIDDNGIGIPQSQQGKLFEKFFRGSNAKVMDTDGTGLGLYIVESVIQSAGGKILYSSTQDKGSSFIAMFPIILKKKEKKRG